VGGEEVEEEEEEDLVSSGCLHPLKLQTEGGPEVLPGGRKPHSHWPGRRCPSRASPPPIGREQRGGGGGLLAGGGVTLVTGDHGGDGEGGSSLWEHRKCRERVKGQETRRLEINEKNCTLNTEQLGSLA